MTARTYLAWFPSRADAERAAETAVAVAPGTRTLIVRGSDGGGALDAVIERAAGRSAARGAAVAVVTAAMLTLAVAFVLGGDQGVSLALGGATAVTAAPFVGGLVGLVVGLQRWTGPPVERLDEGPTPPGFDILLMMRTPDPDRLVAAMGPRATTVRPTISAEEPASPTTS